MNCSKSGFIDYRCPTFRKFSNNQIQEIHFASLEILERTGVILKLPEAADMLKKAGAHVSDGNRVRIPSHLAEWALRAAPKRVVLCNREGNRVMPLEGRKSFFGTGSDCLNILDHRTSERRKARLDDVIDVSKVCDSLENIDFVMSAFLPWDLPQEIMDRYQMQAMLSYSRKPIIFVTPDSEGCADCVKMAEVVAGGEEQLRRNPFIACYINLSADLQHNKESLQKLLFMAGKGLPTTYTPTGNRGALAPMTAAGAQAHMNAGNLTGLVLSQLKREGTPFIWGGWGLHLDMRTQIMPYASPEMIGLGPASAHFYGLPFFGLSGCSDSKVLDGQATAEVALTLMADVLCGSNLIHDLGYLESGLMGSLELLIICDEILGWIKHFMRGIEVTEETLALDLIDKIGPSGHFIDCDHTLHHFREDWYPNLFDRQNYERWLAAGGKTLNERAKEKLIEILDRPSPEILSAEIQKKIGAIIDQAKMKMEQNKSSKNLSS
jgi:trimethylamine--corrinoid protein Co-methyltransferase